MVPPSHPQADRLDDLIRAAGAGRTAAESGLLFASRAGLALVNAAFELFECDELYDLADGICRDIGGDSGSWTIDGRVWGKADGSGRAE